MSEVSGAMKYLEEAMVPKYSVKGHCRNCNTTSTFWFPKGQIKAAIVKYPNCEVHGVNL